MEECSLVSVKSVEIEEECVPTRPCQHGCIITLKSGEKVEKSLWGNQIHVLIASLRPEQIIHTLEQDHFEPCNEERMTEMYEQLDRSQMESIPYVSPRAQQVLSRALETPSPIQRILGFIRLEKSGDQL